MHYSVRCGHRGLRLSIVARLCLCLRMMVMVTTGTIKRAKLQSDHHHQQTNTQLYAGQMPFLLPNQQYQSTRENIEEM